jgi:hypothetical protein
MMVFSTYLSSDRLNAVNQAFRHLTQLLIHLTNEGMLKKENSAKRATITLGRDRFEKICAVEGIKPTPAMKRRFAEFDRKGLSPAEWRREIIKTYGKTSKP